MEFRRARRFPARIVDFAVGHVLLEQVVEGRWIHLPRLEGSGGTEAQEGQNGRQGKEGRPGAHKRHGWVSFGAAFGFEGSRDGRCEIDRLGFASIIPGLFWAMPYGPSAR